MSVLEPPAASTAERAAGIPLSRYRPVARQRRPHPPDRARVIAVSNDAAHDPRLPFWIVGQAADGPGEPDRPWHATAEALWAGDPPDDGAIRIPHPAMRRLTGPDARRRDGARPVVPLAVSWDRGQAAESAGVVWFSDGSTLPLASYLALLHHAGAGANGAPRPAVTWTAAPRWHMLQAERDGARIAALVRLKRAPARDAEAREAIAEIEHWNSATTPQTGKNPQGPHPRPPPPPAACSPTPSPAATPASRPRASRPGRSTSRCGPRRN